ncbi:serine/threonine-protein kinase [Streptacidiphilus sp. N1-3]|uniref:non-specific serine/threonine protein kinase n=1 Tax=Streptacidiphilus alkalitolerans TaxID=3342712 RepID=A0ABV6WSW1_9ACTN
MRPVGSKYLLEEPLGRGATGTVWRARIRDASGVDGLGPEQVAIKVLKEELATDPDVVMRFLRERSVLLRLIHPNIVRVRDLVVEGELLALVMDLVDGPDLNRYLRTHGPLSPVAGALLMAQIADALAASHADGVVHRDLKPANVLLETLRTPEGDEQMHPLLTDFGIARLADSPGLTRTHEFVGTPAYVAPESAEGRQQTAAVDIYGAGIMLYELLTGQPPFHGDGPLQILQAHLSQEPQRPRNVPEPLWTVIEYCLRKDPAQRPDAVTLATALRTVAAGVGVHAGSAQIEAALAVGALLVPRLPAGNDPTVPNGVRYDPGAATVLGAAAYPFGAADPTQVLPPGSAERTQRIPPSNGQFGPPPVPVAAQQTQQAPAAQQGQPHPWENQLRAARTRNEQTRVDYRFPAEAGPQPQVAPPPYRPAPPQAQPPYQEPRYQEPAPVQPAPQARPQPVSRRSAPPAPAPRREPERAPERAPEPAPRREREPRPPRRRRRIPGGGCLRALLVLAVIAACVWYFTPVQDWIHHVESWWHQVVQWWNDVTGTADKIKKGVDSVPTIPSLPTPKG